MDSASTIDWLICSEDGCIGVRLGAGSKCLAHADDPEVDAELRSFGSNGNIDARGVTISGELLARICAAAPRHDQRPDRPCFNTAQFDHATVVDESILGVGKARFDQVVFTNDASFQGSTFNTHVSFKGAIFKKTVQFSQAIFKRAARFDKARFERNASFAGAL